MKRINDVCYLKIQDQKIYIIIHIQYFVLSLWFNSFNNLQFKWTHYNKIVLRLQLKIFM